MLFGLSASLYQSMDTRWNISAVRESVKVFSTRKQRALRRARVCLSAGTYKLNPYLGIANWNSLAPQKAVVDQKLPFQKASILHDLFHTLEHSTCLEDVRARQTPDMAVHPLSMASWMFMIIMQLMSILLDTLL